MTLVRWLHGQPGHESTDNTKSVVLCVGVFLAWPIDTCSNKDAGRSQSKTPTLVNVNKREDKDRTDKTTLWKFTCFHNDTF